MKTRINVGQASCPSHLFNHPLKRTLILKTSETGWKPALLWVALFLSISTLQPPNAAGQSYSIDWYKIAGGGGTSTGGVYAISGTIGQLDAGGPMAGGNYSLTGGFWALISVVQTAGAPALNLSHSGNTMMIYWQDTSGWSLEQNNDLAVTNGWSASRGVTTTNGMDYLNLTLPTGNLFFRLVKP